ncbi:MAG: ABC transporter substrate-binding protein [Acetobacteraceae bacterium]|nr:peptide ABC transporter substrate-binding protein [Pseudomonadota bacterium]
MRLLTLVLPSALAAIAAATPARAADPAPHPGGTLHMYQRDNPASASVLEEATYSTNVPFMGLYNNLIRYKQDVAQNSDASLEPELATAWTWGPDNKSLTFKLREGVKWHDGKPFTAADVKCTWDLIQDKAKDKLRKNPRKLLWNNVQDVVPNGDHEVTFQLGRPQPSLLALFASGYSAVYPCHATPAQQRTKPIGTGPFMLAEFKQNEMIRLVKNPNYWKKDRPYLDAIEMPIMTSRATAMLAFQAHKLDMTFPLEVTPPLLRDIKKEVPTAICAFGPMNVNSNLIVNRQKPPFDNADIRQAMALTIDRKAFVDILFEGKAEIGGTLLPAPAGIWGMPDEMKKQMVGYDPDVAKNREQARAIMKKLGYGPDHHLAVKVSTRNIPSYRDAAVILIDHLKEIWIDGELEPMDTPVWFAKLAKKDYSVGLNLTGNSLDDPDQAFYENFACKSERNYSEYCSPELEKQFDAQSQETDVEKRKKMVWAIDQQLQNDVARPIILHMEGGTCWWPQVHGFTQMVNSSYNGYRFEDLWIEH